MIRFFVLLALFTLIALIGFLAAETAGSVTIFWLGYRIDTTFSFLLLATLLTAFAAYFSYGLISSFIKLPWSIKETNAYFREREGLKLLTQSWVSLTTGDLSGGRKQLQRAEKRLGSTPLVLLLTAQLARMEGNGNKLDATLEQMLAHKETQIVAGKGLIDNAKAHGSYARAIDYAERIRKEAPQNSWLARALFELYLHEHHWDKAHELIGHAARKKAISKEDKPHLSALAYYLEAKERHQREGSEKAISLYEKAHKASYAFIPATITLAQLYQDLGKTRAAKRTLSHSWKVSSLPALADQYEKLFSPSEDDSLFKQLSESVAHATHPHAAQLAVAKIAMRHKRFDLARTYLETALTQKETVNGCKLMAELAITSRLNSEEERAWLQRSQKAAADESWVCGVCEEQNASWQPNCSYCHSFDSIQWKLPLKAVRVGKLSDYSI